MSLVDYLVVFLVLGVAFAVAALLLLRHIAAQREQMERLKQDISQLHGSVSAIISGASGMDRRTGRLEQRQQEQLRRIEDMEEIRQTVRPYDEAIRLVRQGANAQRLIEELGLSRGEADLLIMLHGAEGEDAGH